MSHAVGRSWNVQACRGDAAFSELGFQCNVVICSCGVDRLVPAGQARAGNSVLWVVMCVHLAEGYGLEDFDDLNSSEPLKSRGSGGTTPGGGARAGSGMERQPSGGSTPGDARRQGGGGGGSSSSAGQVSSSRASGSAPDSDLRRLLFKFPDVSDESRAVVIALLMTGSLARTWSRFE